MQLITADMVEARLSYPALVDVLDAAFRNGANSPPRHHLAVPLEGRPEATWLLMPAISASAPGRETAGKYFGLKSVTVFPDNAKRGLGAVLGMYLLNTTESGQTIAVIDATRLTVWRTAAASALASRYLSRPDSETMVILGAGQLAPYMVRAHASVRPIKRVMVWNRSEERARAMVKAMQGGALHVELATDLEAAVRAADLVSCATMSTEPLVKGAWLRPGTHVDCAGAFKESMRETDDEVVRRARIFADTMDGCWGEAGDILQPLKAGVIKREAVLGDLYDLTRGKLKGRESREEITFFKSVGASIEDLAAAVALYEAG